MCSVCSATPAGLSGRGRSSWAGSGANVAAALLFLADEHFRRLDSSLAAIRLDGVDTARLRARMNETLAQSGVHEGIVYIQLTRGAAARKHAFPKGTPPLELLWVQEFADPYIEGR